MQVNLTDSVPQLSKRGLVLRPDSSEEKSPEPCPKQSALDQVFEGAVSKEGLGAVLGPVVSLHDGLDRLLAPEHGEKFPQVGVGPSEKNKVLGRGVHRVLGFVQVISRWVLLVLDQVPRVHIVETLVVVAGQGVVEDELERLAEGARPHPGRSLVVLVDVRLLVDAVANEIHKF